MNRYKVMAALLALIVTMVIGTAWMDKLREIRLSQAVETYLETQEAIAKIDREWRAAPRWTYPDGTEVKVRQPFTFQRYRDHERKILDGEGGS